MKLAAILSLSLFVLAPQVTTAADVEDSCYERRKLCFMKSEVCVELCNSHRMSVCYDDCLTDLQNSCEEVLAGCPYGA